MNAEFLGGINVSSLTPETYADAEEVLAAQGSPYTAEDYAAAARTVVAFYGEVGLDPVFRDLNQYDAERAKALMAPWMTAYGYQTFGGYADRIAPEINLDHHVDQSPPVNNAGDSDDPYSVYSASIGLRYITAWSTASRLQMVGSDSNVPLAEGEAFPGTNIENFTYGEMRVAEWNHTDKATGQVTPDVLYVRWTPTLTLLGKVNDTPHVEWTEAGFQPGDVIERDVTTDVWVGLLPNPAAADGEPEWLIDNVLTSAAPVPVSGDINTSAVRHHQQ